MYWNVIVSSECSVQVLQTGRTVQSIRETNRTTCELYKYARADLRAIYDADISIKSCVLSEKQTTFLHDLPSTCQFVRKVILHSREYRNIVALLNFILCTHNDFSC